MTWTPRSISPSASPCSTTGGSSSRARAPRWWPIRRPGRSTLATEALSLSGIDVLYGDSHVLHEVSFNLQKGKVLALLGRNGAGKSTCMSAIIGFLAPRRGAIRLFGEPIAGLAPEAIARNGVGFVPQGRRLVPTLPVTENLSVAFHQKNSKTWHLSR